MSDMTRPDLAEARQAAGVAVEQAAHPLASEAFVTDPADNDDTDAAADLRDAAQGASSAPPLRPTPVAGEPPSTAADPPTAAAAMTVGAARAQVRRKPRSWRPWVASAAVLAALALDLAGLAGHLAFVLPCTVFALIAAWTLMSRPKREAVPLPLPWHPPGLSAMGRAGAAGRGPRMAGGSAGGYGADGAIDPDGDGFAPTEFVAPPQPPLPGLMALLDRKGLCIAASPALARWLGTDRDALVGLDVGQAFGSEAAAMIQPKLAGVLEGRLRRLRCLHVDANGLRRWLQMELQPRQNEYGELVGVDLLAMDITPEQRRLEKLVRHERRTRHFLAHMPTPVVYLALDGTCRFVNEAEARWQGSNAASIIDRHAAELMGDDWAALEPQLKAALNGEALPVHRSRTLADGRIEQQMGQPVVDRDSNGQAVGVFVVYVDDTERQALASRLEAASDALRHMRMRSSELARAGAGPGATGATDATAGTEATDDRDAQDASATTATTAQIDAPAADAADAGDGHGDSLADMPPEEAAAVRAAIAAALADLDDLGDEAAAPTAHPSTRSTQSSRSSASVMSDPDASAPPAAGAPPSAVAATTTPGAVPPARRTSVWERLVQHHDRQQRERTASAPAPPAAPHGATAAPPAHGIEPAEPELVDLLEDAVHRTTPVANARGVSLSCRFGPRLPRQLLEGTDTLQDLLEQLLHHGLADGHVEALRLDISRLDQDRLSVSVERHGDDCAPADPPAAWTDALQAAGGRWGVDKEPGQGHRLWFTWPANERSDRAGIRPKEAIEGLRGHVLVADASAYEREVLTQRLADAGLECSTADSADALMQVLRAAREGEAMATPVRLVLLDGRLPGGDAAQLATRVREQEGAQAPAIVLMDTAVGPETWADAAEAGVAARLEKPLRRRELWRTLRGLLCRDASAIPHLSAMRDDPAASALPLAAAQPLPVVHARVLLAEDNGVAQLAAQNMLESLGCDYDLADNGAQALAAIERELFDLLLLDCAMPDVDGPSVARALRDRERRSGLRRRVPVIGLLDGANGAERAACQAAGMDDCLVKPFTREQLTEAVRRWLPPQLIEPSDPTGKPSHSKLAA